MGRCDKREERFVGEERATVVATAKLVERGRRSEE